MEFVPHSIGHLLGGGTLIGLAVSLAFALTGQITGMSTVFASTWSWFSPVAWSHQREFLESSRWRLTLALELLLGGGLRRITLGDRRLESTEVSAGQLALGGFLVGFGTRTSRGCTTGHGICDVASLQWPSIAAVLIAWPAASGHRAG